MAEPNPNKIAGYQNLVNIFDGEIFTNINYFINNLKEIGEIATWNDAELIAVLKSKLKGPALQFFIDDPELANEKKFDCIISKFKKYFENKTTLSHRQQQFSNCRQNPGELVRSFATRVSNLTINYFGIQNASKPDAGPIVDQTKLAKFLEGLNPDLKRLALTRNPSSFEEAVENALLDEINSQFTIPSIQNISTSNEKSSSDSKLSEVLGRQLDISNQMIGALSSQLEKLTTQISIQQQQQLNTANSNFNRYNDYSRRQPCTHCGRKNHHSSQCYSMRNHNTRISTYRGNRMENSTNQQMLNNQDARVNSSYPRQSNSFSSYAIRGRNPQNSNRQNVNRNRHLN